MLRFRSIAVSHFTFLVTLVVIKYSQFIDENSKRQWIEYCLNDNKLCANCFISSIECIETMDDIELIDDIESTINSMFGSRTIQMGRFISTGKPIVLKHITNLDKFNVLRQHICDNEINCKLMANSADAERIEHFVRSSERIDGIQKCKNGVTTNFVQTLNRFKMPTIFWTQLFVNPELVLLNVLNNDPQFDQFVPKLYNSNGFVLIESFDGVSLYEFYAHQFRDRLRLAKNLLHAAHQFSIGTNGLRIYLTDLTPDNIVVDAKTLRTTFVDLDNTLIVDSTLKFNASTKANSDWNRIHRHEQIECNGCFAYVPEEICAHHLSDLNLFSVCQLLMTDLNGNRNGGLLHSIPNTADNELLSLLESCVYCNHSSKFISNRFECVEPLIAHIDHLIETISTET